MYNVEKLEQQWLRYRRKKILVPLFASLGLISSAAAVFYFVGGTQTGSSSDPESTRGSSANAIATATGAGERSPVQKPAARLGSLATEVPSLETERAAQKPRVGQIIFQEDAAPSTSRRKKKKSILIQVSERGSKDIAADIENRFEFAKDKSDSLFLAKYYYDKMNYPKAEKWALETNKLDNTIEESWLIFAKAQAKQGKRLEALKVLKAFYEQSSSPKAKVLMDKIRRGKRF